MSRTRVLIVDDQVLFTKSLSVLLETKAPQLDVVGVAYDGVSALRMVDELAPHLVLMDVRMPRMDGVECTREIKRRHPSVQVIVLTTFDDDEYVVDAIEMGASGYLLKDVDPDELIAAVSAVTHGGITMSPKVATKLARLGHGELLPKAETARQSESSSARRLSPREREILELMCRNYSNKDIAERLFIAEQTVRNHVSVIYTKLGVADRFEAIRVAQRTQNRSG